jgi:assimilatory nitrate reductase catalytic subunit
MAGLGVNALTTGAYCPQSRQPELKHAAVKLEAAALPWQLVAAAWVPQDEAAILRERFRGLFSRFGYAVCLPFGREPQPRLGVLFRAAAANPEPEALAELEGALGLGSGAVLRYADPRASQLRAMRLHGDGSLQAFLLAGDAAAQGWMLELLKGAQPATAFGQALLAARRQPPQPVAPRSRQVCACHDVSEQAIAAELRGSRGNEGERLQQLQDRLRCGTECGSCLPALKVLVQQQGQEKAAA